jgi:hypothetical protein
MNNKYPSKLLFIVLSLAGSTAMAGSLACNPGFTHVTISQGVVSTMNVSSSKQVGHMCLTMQDDAGRVVFEDCGALIGMVTEADGQGMPSKLSHTLIFDMKQGLQTSGDTLLYAVPLSACSFQVGESLTRLNWGSGVFQGGSLNVRADGVLSYCPDDNKNTLALSGEACMRLKRHSHRW